MLASQWDEEEIDRSRIDLWEENDDGSDREDASEEEPQNVEKAAATVESSRDSAKEAVRNEREQPEESNTEVQSDNSRMQTEQRDNNRMQAEADKPEVSVQATGLKEETQPRESLLDAFLRLQKREHTVELYEIGKHRVSSIHIELRDIRELPKQYWNLGNNSFLLHGFFNYRYLLLGKKLENDKETVFIGVPGVYHNQERMIAALFGFPEFLPENRKLEQTESPGELFETLRTAEARREAGRQEQPKELFGYWCHALVE